MKRCPSCGFEWKDTEPPEEFPADLMSAAGDELPFVSPVVSSFTVKAKLKVGGEVVQPPVDVDN